EDDPAMRCRILLVGFGNVGREFARLLLERRSELAKVHGLDAAVVGIVTGRHGSVERARGIDLRKALRLADAGASLESCGRGVHGRSAEYIRRARADVVIEITPLRIAPRQIGVDHIVAALSGGKHVITANKGPVVYHYRRLKELARTQGLGFRYEGTVMDGAPVFNLFQETLRGIRILSFEGILNSTTNLILSMMEGGRTYEDGVKSARHMGFLETEPAMDLEGWDATVKACLLANVWMGGRLPGTFLSRIDRMVRQMRIVLGGTLGLLHAGHEALLRAAFDGRPEAVVIGLTTDRFARESRTRVNPYVVRERNLKRFLAAKK